MTNDAPPASMRGLHASDADLRLVAEAVGFQPAGLVGGRPAYRLPGKSGFCHPVLLSDLQHDDAEAAKWLLPWLQRKADEKGCALHTITDRFGGTEAALWPRDSTTPLLTSSTRPEPVSFAAALFDLCHQLVEENPTMTTHYHCPNGCGAVLSSKTRHHDCPESPEKQA